MTTEALTKNITKLFSLANYNTPRQPMTQNEPLNNMLPLLKRWTMNECKQRLCIHTHQVIEKFQVLGYSILYWKEEYFFFLEITPFL